MQLRRQLDQDDDEEEETCYFCFKIRRKKQTNKNSQSYDKMSMQNLSNDHHIKESKKQIIKESITKSVSNISEYPKNKLFFLNNRASKEEIIAKITEKKFNIDDQSLLSKIKQNREQMESTPECIARYIAKRLKEFIIITDLGCGSGCNTIQMAKECHYVIGVEKDTKLIKKAESNCANENVYVDLIKADIFTLNNLKTDVIFVNPSLNNEIQTQQDLINHFSPDIKTILLNHQKNVKNFVFQLPPKIDISQLPLLLNINSQFTQFRQNYPSFFSIEIEEIILNQQLEYIVVYCGDVSDIKQSDIIKFLTKQFRRVQPDYNSIQKQHLFWLFEWINRNIGIQNLTYRLIPAIKQKKSIEYFCKMIQQQFSIHQDLYQTYINHNKNDNDDINSTSKQDQDQQDINNMSPSNFSYKQIEVTNMNYSYNNENIFEDEEIEIQNSFVMNINH